MRLNTQNIYVNMMVTFLANICTVLTDRNIKKNTKEIKCRCSAWVNVLYTSKLYEKDNNLSSFFQLFFKGMLQRLEENKENSSIKREREVMVVLLNEGRLKKIISKMT